MESSGEIKDLNRLEYRKFKRGKQRRFEIGKSLMDYKEASSREIYRSVKHFRKGSSSPGKIGNSFHVSCTYCAPGNLQRRLARKKEEKFVLSEGLPRRDSHDCDYSY